jgi:hypothetical protein
MVPVVVPVLNVGAHFGLVSSNLDWNQGLTSGYPLVPVFFFFFFSEISILVPHLMEHGIWFWVQFFKHVNSNFCSGTDSKYQTWFWFGSY